MKWSCHLIPTYVHSKVKKTILKKITPMAFQQLFCPESIPFVFTGYAIASTTATQLKQAVSLGQDLTAYATYEGYPAFAVTTRGDAYGVF